MEEYILSRQILIVLFCAQCLFTYFGSTFKANMTAKAYNAFFCIEAVLVTAYIVYACIAEPFYFDIVSAILGYTLVYGAILFSFLGLKHWTIVPNKIYDFYPDHVKEWDNVDDGCGGYIRESGKKIYVYVNDDELFKDGNKKVPIKVKYREWKNFSARFDVAKS